MLTPEEKLELDKIDDKCRRYLFDNMKDEADANLSVIEETARTSVVPSNYAGSEACKKGMYLTQVFSRALSEGKLDTNQLKRFALLKSLLKSLHHNTIEKLAGTITKQATVYSARESVAEADSINRCAWAFCGSLLKSLDNLILAGIINADVKSYNSCYFDKYVDNKDRTGHRKYWKLLLKSIHLALKHKHLSKEYILAFRIKGVD